MGDIIDCWCIGSEQSESDSKRQDSHHWSKFFFILCKCHENLSDNV